MDKIKKKNLANIVGVPFGIYVCVKYLFDLLSPPRSAKSSDPFMTIQTSNQMDVLGSPMAIIEAAPKGVSRKKADVLAQAIGLTDREMARILQMPERTFHRYKDDTLLGTNASEKLLTLALLYQKRGGNF